MSIVQLLVKNQCYYGGRVISEGSIIDFDTDNLGKDKDGDKTVWPSWGEIIKGEVAKDAEPEKTEFREATLHGMASKPAPKVRTANTKSKSK